MSGDHGDDFDREIDAMVAEAKRAFRASHEGARLNHEGSRAAMHARLALLPRKVARALRTFTLHPLAHRALDEIERELFGWTEANRPNLPIVSAKWRGAVQRDARPATLKVVRRVVREVKRTAHLEQLGGHDCASSLPSWQQDPVVRGGVLHIRDVPSGVRTFGVRGYVEATPVEVPVLVARRWMTATGKAHPRCWDLTAGSGTVGDLIRVIFGGVVAEFDIANQRAVSFGDLRKTGRHPLHQALPRVAGERRSPTSVAKPNLVFLHAPSAGEPTASLLEGSDPSVVARDLGVLATLEGRDAYLEVLAEAIQAALERLAPGGLISVLVPEYLRFQQQVLPEPGVADALLARLEGRCVLVERHMVEDVAPVAQVSIGRSRGPLVHLMLAAASEKISEGE